MLICEVHGSRPNVEKYIFTILSLFIIFVHKEKMLFMCSEMEFKEFEPRFKSAKTWFKLSAGLNLETFHTILSGTNHI